MNVSHIHWFHIRFLSGFSTECEKYIINKIFQLEIHEFVCEIDFI